MKVDEDEVYWECGKLGKYEMRGQFWQKIIGWEQIWNVLH